MKNGKAIWILQAIDTIAYSVNPKEGFLNENGIEKLRSVFARDIFRQDLVQIYCCNSCRNRHCPKCQTLAKEQWIEKQEQNLLNVGYFHVVFTMPDQLNPVIRAGQFVQSLLS